MLDLFCTLPVLSTSYYCCVICLHFFHWTYEYTFNSVYTWSIDDGQLFVHFTCGHDCVVIGIEMSVHIGYILNITCVFCTKCFQHYRYKTEFKISFLKTRAKSFKNCTFMLSPKMSNRNYRLLIFNLNLYLLYVNYIELMKSNK